MSRQWLYILMSKNYNNIEIRKKGPEFCTKVFGLHGIKRLGLKYKRCVAGIWLMSIKGETNNPVQKYVFHLIYRVILITPHHSHCYPHCTLKSNALRLRKVSTVFKLRLVVKLRFTFRSFWHEAMHALLGFYPQKKSSKTASRTTKWWH